MKKAFANQSDNSLKIIIVVLSSIILLTLLYTYKVSERPKKIITSLREEKATVIKDLEKTKSLLSLIKTENKTLDDKLSLEKEKINKLLKKLKKNGLSEENIAEYKKSIELADERIKSLMVELENYIKANDSINLALNTEKRKNDNLETSNSELKKSNTTLSEQINVASKLNYYGLQTKFFKVKSDGKEAETDYAKKTNLIKINFSIAENKLVEPFDKKFYIQIFDPKINVLGSKKNLGIRDDILTYSTEVAVKYENENTKASTELKVENLEKGRYIINVFDDTKSILQSEFILK